MGSLFVITGTLCLGLQLAAGYVSRPCYPGLSMGNSMHLQVSCTADSGVEVTWTPIGADVELLQIEYLCRDTSDNAVVTSDILLHNSLLISGTRIVPETSNKDIECTISGCYEEVWSANYAIPPVSCICDHSPDLNTGIHFEPDDDDLQISSDSMPSSTSLLPLLSPSAVENQAGVHSSSITSISVMKPSTTPERNDIRLWESRTFSTVLPTSTFQLLKHPSIATSGQGSTAGTSSLDVASIDDVEVTSTTTVSASITQLQETKNTIFPTDNPANGNISKNDLDLKPLRLETAVIAIALVAMVGLMVIGVLSLILTLAFMSKRYMNTEQRKEAMDIDKCVGRNTSKDNTYTKSCKHFIAIA